MTFQDCIAFVPLMSIKKFGWFLFLAVVWRSCLWVLWLSELWYILILCWRCAKLDNKSGSRYQNAQLVARENVLHDKFYNHNRRFSLGFRFVASHSRKYHKLMARCSVGGNFNKIMGVFVVMLCSSVWILGSTFSMLRFEDMYALNTICMFTMASTWYFFNQQILNAT